MEQPLLYWALQSMEEFDSPLNSTGRGCEHLVGRRCPKVWGSKRFSCQCGLAENKNHIFFNDL